MLRPFDPILISLSFENLLGTTAIQHGSFLAYLCPGTTRTSAKRSLILGTARPTLLATSTAAGSTWLATSPGPVPASLSSSPKSTSLDRQ